MFIIRFFFLAILFLLILCLLGAFLFFSSIRKIVKSFMSGSNSNWEKDTSHASQNERNGQTITDNRTHEQRDKRIFASDEGEYVDFEETAD